MALSAREGKLRYVNDNMPGFSRKLHGKSFRYRDIAGKPINTLPELARIKALAIPPAWTNVWICPHERGHLQATGRDAKGRKQYRYHKQWRVVRDEVKYEHMIDFGQHLPLIRQKVDEELSKPGLSRTKVLATIIYLLESTMIRIGNDEYAKTNQSFGLTTLRNRHVDIHGSNVQFSFLGKSKVVHKVSLRDPRIARILKRIKDLPGQELFQYTDIDGTCHSIDSASVNEYLQEITGHDYTAKDFRTWSGTIQTVLALKAMQQFESASEAKKNVIQAITAAAKKLGNTPSICKKCYVHPLIVESYLAGGMFDSLATNNADKNPGLDEIEQYVLRLLKNQIKPE